MKRTLLALVALAATAAMATGPAQQVISSSLINSGSISNTVKTEAAVKGLGTSYSAATGGAGVVANAGAKGVINPVCTGACGAVSGEVAVTGEVKTYNNASAFNVSTGGGTGMASSNGTAVAAVKADAAYSGPGQNVSVKADMAAQSAVGVQATRNTGGVAAAANDASVSITGAVGSKACTGANTPCGTSTTKEVWGSVADVKNSTSSGGTGNMTVDGVVLAPANTSATANAVVNASGQFADPI